MSLKSNPIKLKVLSDLGLSDKAATIDLRQLSLLINDEIIQSQVVKMMVVILDDNVKLLPIS